jgi:hypothetical protein
VIAEKVDERGMKKEGKKKVDAWLGEAPDKQKNLQKKKSEAGRKSLRVPKQVRIRHCPANAVDTKWRLGGYLGATSLPLACCPVSGT